MLIIMMYSLVIVIVEAGTLLHMYMLINKDKSPMNDSV